MVEFVDVMIVVPAVFLLVIFLYWEFLIGGKLLPGVVYFGISAQSQVKAKQLSWVAAIRELCWVSLWVQCAGAVVYLL